MPISDPVWDGEEGCGVFSACDLMHWVFVGIEG